MMKRIVITSVFLVVCLTSVYCEDIGKDTTLSDLLKELEEPSISGDQLANEVEAVGLMWEGHLQERRLIAETVAALAAKYEEENQFDKALILYEKLLEEFPEQEELFFEIKREHALEEVTTDLSTPEKAFQSLKHGLFIYRLTADTFGVCDPGAVIYKPYSLDYEGIEDIAEEAEVVEAEDNEENASLAKRLDEYWPEFIADPWRQVSKSRLLERTVDIKGDELTIYMILDKLRRDYGVPFVITPAARATMAKADSEQRKSINLQSIPINAFLKYFLRLVAPEIRFRCQTFGILLYHKEHDKDKEFVTAVTQMEPWGVFPDSLDEEEESEASFDVDGVKRHIIRIFDLKEFPDDWYVFYGNLGILRAPREYVELWSGRVAMPSAGTYHGRVNPLLRCLRAYPLVGDAVDRYKGFPRDRYIYLNQCWLQTKRMQRFLDDRLLAAKLLQSSLTGFDAGANNRYKPEIDLLRNTDFGSRLGLWLDGFRYRFLIFDSEKSRTRWLNGEDCVDIPNDVDEHDWPTEEEWRERLEKQLQETGEHSLPNRI